MKIESSTAGRKEDVREKVTRLKLVVLDDDERLFLAALRRAIWDNEPITLGDKTWQRVPVETTSQATGG